MHGLVVAGLTSFALVVMQYTKNILHFAAHDFARADERRWCGRPGADGEVV